MSKPTTQIKKAVFPVFGYGTRFLPITKALPKEMLPIIDKPLLHYAVKEAVDAGIEDLIFIVGGNRQSIEDYFDRNLLLESKLREEGKEDLLRMVEEIVPSNVNCIFIRQHAPIGLGHAVLQARPAIGDEPFAVLLVDDLFYCEEQEPSALQKLINTYFETRSTVIATHEVGRDIIQNYGVIEGILDSETGSYVLSDIIEKPNPSHAPSNMAILGRYVLESDIFESLRQTQPGKNGEIQLTDGIGRLLKSKQVRALPITNLHFDCGSKEGWYRANMFYGRKVYGFKE
ncbi:UTP--glucose-1-phosphate uridylyltransferase [Taylorella asinigenitalis 14/45]|uniref:UTP--glucose-1-phosphate uridylyltransferase n=1 Tax=Taylorella asinigenitalis 14/45 TaxID=1091495 RepID=I7IBV3_9BURK|nr:UTP--glucose-1-phosphate uridylyltransferase GalU [Taylorella asinigenitalis]CCG19450.1 UTP--glucose-1-phosphate uridylyltransferase [Taylorella asinigenitalis 14/45]